MDDWKSTEWWERVKNKAPQYWIRAEIEEIVKEENIDRTRFHEFSKFKYGNIIKKFYYAFSDCNDFKQTISSLDNLHIRSSLEGYVITRYSVTEDWAEYLKTIQSVLPFDTGGKLFLILLEGFRGFWVYEGYADEIFRVLKETNTLLSDFFIVPKKFDWFIVHDDVEESAYIYIK